MVRGVQCLSPRVSLLVHRSAGRDERGDVGDRVADAIALPAALEVESLVEILDSGGSIVKKGSR